MTYEEFRRQLGKAGLTIKAFANLIEQTPNSITNYSSQGQIPMHLAIMAALMGDMAESGVDFRMTLRRIDVGTKRRTKERKGRFRGSRQIDLLLSSPQR